jgi:hypothetical protein
MQPQSELLVDCYGSSYRPEYLVEADGFRTRFVFDPALKSGRRFSLAVFLDAAAFSRACYRYPRNRRIGLLLETPLRGFQHRAGELLRRYDHVGTFYQELLALGPPFMPFCFGTSWVETQLAEADLKKLRLVSFVGSIRHGEHNGYVFRSTVARRLMVDGRVDCFGYGIREISSKLEGLAPYAFSVAMENVRYDGYFTEKLIDCFLTDTVPIYWGSSGIGRWFDPRGILCFERQDQLLMILDTLDWERYASMLPFVRRNRDRARQENWDSTEGIYRRLAALIQRLRLTGSQMPRFSTTKPLALLRWLGAGIGKPRGPNAAAETPLR